MVAQFTRSRMTLVVGGVAVAGVLFGPYLVQVIQRAVAFGSASGLAVVPALVVGFLTAITYDLVRRVEKDRLDRAAAAAAAAAARDAKLRANEIEQLLSLGQALGQSGTSLEAETTQETLLQHLQPLAGDRDMWLTVRTKAWRLVVGTPPDSVSEASDFKINPASRLSGWETFPLWVEGQWIGMMGVRQDPKPLTEEQRRLIEMATFLVASALKNAHLIKRARQLSAVDELTGCLTRQHGEGLIESELRRADRASTPVSMIFIDLDRFKSINDHYGHLYGDKVLGVIGRILKKTLRGSDLRCRFGGEEFVLLLPGTPLAGAKQVAESVRRAVGRESLETPKGTLTMTASFGVTVALPGEVDTKSLLARADAAMYRAKKEGRNTVRVWEDEPETKRTHPRNVGAANRREPSDAPESDRSETALDELSGPGLDDLM